MGKSSPPPPDYTGAAEATGASQLDAIAAQTRANRPNVTTPWGSQTWRQVGGTAGTPFNAESYLAANPDVAEAVRNGSTSALQHWTNYGREEGRQGSGYTPGVEGSWESSINLDPRAQAALDSQMNLQTGRSQLAEGMLGRVGENFSTPFDWSGLPSRSGNVQAGQLQTGLGPSAFSWGSLDGDSSAYRDRAQSAVEQLQAPGLARRRASVETQLANQGIPVGSEAHTAAMQEVDDAESRAGLQAIDAGRTEADSMFARDLSGANFDNTTRGQDFTERLSTGNFGNLAQQQQLEAVLRASGFNNSNREGAVQEQQLRRTMSLNELNALLTGQQVTMPGIPGAPQAGSSGGVDYAGAVSQQYGANLAASNAENAQTSANVGTASTLGALAYMAGF